MRALLIAAFALTALNAASAQSDDWQVAVVTDELEFAEGPVLFEGALLVSDVNADRIVRLSPSGETATFRAPSNFANGNTVDRQGRLITAEHGGRVVRREADGGLTVLADRFEGRRLNSPNDLAVAPDGAIWFTDPTFGLEPPAGPVQRTAELTIKGVYRIDPENGALSLILSRLTQPNGIVFSADGRELYVSDSANGQVLAYPMVNGRPDEARGRVIATFAAAREAVVDGLALDDAGRLLVAAPSGIVMLDSDGRVVGEIATAVPPTDVLFDPASRAYWITARSTVYRASTAEGE